MFGADDRALLAWTGRQYIGSSRLIGSEARERQKRVSALSDQVESPDRKEFAPIQKLGACSTSLENAPARFAAIFAIVHPPLSIIPVFFLGVCAALVYERTKMLVAAMLVHAFYNAAVIGFQWNVMQ